MLITGETGVYCIVGYPIGHSLSPAIHNAGFEAAGLNCVFVAFALHPQRFAEGFEGLKTLGILGMTVTVPLKELAFSAVDEVDEYAGMTGAVNTVLFSESGTKGYNLDVAGVKHSLEEMAVPENARTAVVIGAGGAARAVVAALMIHGVRRIIILNRDKGRAEALRSFSGRHCGSSILVADGLDGETLRKHLSEASLLVNTTPLGMYPHPETSPVPIDLIPRGIMVLDAVYRPRATMLLKEARRRDCATMDGLDWLIHQASLAFRLWTGEDLDKKAVTEMVSGRFSSDNP